MTDSPMLTIAEVAALLRVSKWTVQNMIHGKLSNCPQLPSIRLGDRILVRKESLDKYLAAMEKGKEAA